MAYLTGDGGMILTINDYLADISSFIPHLSPDNCSMFYVTYFKAFSAVVFD